MQINFDSIINAAIDYIGAQNRYMTTHRNAFIAYHNPQAYEVFETFTRAEAVLWAVCEATGIPVNAAISAARIEDRYFQRGGTRIVDSRRLILSQIKSA